MYNILVCDDDKEIVEAIEIYLTKEGYNILKAYNGEEALKIIEENEIHLVILDIMMPKINGIQVASKIRENKGVPIIMLSAKSEDYDKISGLNTGADDYVTKPFNPVEVVARVKSQIRRYTMLGAMPKPQNNVLTFGGVSLDDDSKEVTVDGEVVNLTPLEFNILSLLMHNAGKVYSSNQIYNEVWKDKIYSGSDATVAVHIRHLREKIEINPAEPRYLKVVWGQGYKFSIE